VNYRDTGIEAFKIEDMAQLLQVLVDDKIIESSGIQIIRTVLDEGGSPDRIMESE
jgi:aspartyl-tRNA(Asn)/glutamyl-tRNA(Gln) amidotransferase subunit B